METKYILTRSTINFQKKAPYVVWFGAVVGKRLDAAQYAEVIESRQSLKIACIEYAIQLEATQRKPLLYTVETATIIGDDSGIISAVTGRGIQ